MDVVLVPAGHTYVVYEEGDHLGHLLAYLTLLPLFIGFSLGVLVLVRRDIQTAMFLIGILANEISNYYLKHTIQEARPVRSAGKVVVKYGMPSSHAQFTGFFVAYMIMVVCYRIRLTRTAAPLWLSRLGQGVAAAGLAVMGLLIAYSRIHLHYHTSRQVIAGSLIGALFGLAWYYLVHGPLQPILRALTGLTLAKWLLIKDYSRTNDIIAAEYAAIMAASSKQA